MSKNKLKEILPKNKDKGKKNNSNTLWESIYIRLREYRYLFLAFILSIVGFIIYSDTLKVPFYFDDFDLIIDNPYIKSLSYFSNYSGIADLINFRYFSNLTFALNYHYSGMDVINYHIVNILIHLASSIFVMLLVKQILNSTTITESLDNNDKFKIVALTALIFLVHPIQTQAVTYIVQRMTSLATLFYLASIYFYLVGRNIYKKEFSTRNKLKIITVFIFSALAFTLGILSKQIAATIPLTIILCEILLIRNKKNEINWIIVGSISMLLLGVGILMFLTIGLPVEADNISRSVYLSTQIDVVFTYFRLLFLPINQNIDYDFPLRLSLWDFEIIFKILLLAALVIFSIKMLEKNAILTFGVFWFFITISVESSIIPIRDVINEHRLYLPILGFALIISYYVLLISKKFSNPKSFTIISLILLMALAIPAYNRNKLWNDPDKMWSDVISKSPKKDRPYLARGAFYLRSNLFDAAVFDFQKVISLNKNEFRAYDNLGYALQAKNHYKEALSYHDQAIRINPKSSISYNNRGVCYLYLQNWNDAIKDFEKAVDLFHNYTDAYFNLGYVYYINKEYDKSTKYFIQALDLNPSYQDIYPYIVMNSYMSGNLDQARNYYDKMKQIGMKIPNSIKNIMGN